MERKTLHMIGNSHIDPVWFWQWQEGMQEVRATLASALDRMREYPDFRFSATSAAFFAYLAQADPELLAQLRQRVLEGRLELCGGWWIEPDCNLPGGESFARQALYGQRTFLRLFGRKARIGSNVDSFGHNPQMPQLLRQGGLEGYLFFRPCVASSPRELTPGRIPAFRWVAPDGSSVPAVSLPGEYTTWFYESTRENVEKTLRAIGDLPALPCCFGVGNHGGGPTIANIEAVRRLAGEFPEHDLRFSTAGACFDDLRDVFPRLPQVRTYFDHVNTGCYSVDHLLKQKLRQAEAALLRAEKLQVLARLLGADAAPESTEPLWERLLFCQFHDTLGGTVIEEAHEDALNNAGGIIHQAEAAAHLAVQRITGRLHTPGKGVPIYLFNLTEKPWEGIADVELNWFCRDDLRLLGPDGQEIPYIRVKQSCTMVWLRLGGRRRILFRASVPAFGAAVYYADAEPAFLRLPVSYTGDAFTLDNGLVSFRLDPAGRPVSLRDLSSGFESLEGPCEFTLWQDDRDPWGGGGQQFAPAPCAVAADSVECVESSEIRKVLRVRQHTDGLQLETHYTLCAGEPFVRMTCSLVWNRPWHQLRLRLPAAAVSHVCESPYGVMTHGAADGELFMHRFVDARREGGAGLAVAADSISAFQPADGVTELLLLRSPIFAQGADRSLWMHAYDTYHYQDIGAHHFTLWLIPHASPLPQHALFALADRLEQGTLYLAGSPADRRGDLLLPPFSLSSPSVRLGAAKRAEEGDAVVLRLHETDGAPAEAAVSFGGRSFSLTFRPYEIKTVRIDANGPAETDFLEGI